MERSLNSMGLIFALTGLLLTAGPPPASADQNGSGDPRGIKNFLTKHTIIYTDKLGAKNSIYFGQFGSFDWYFPCQIESGAWKLDADQVLHLSYDTSTFEPKKYKLARTDEGITLSATESETKLTAEILAGNKLPLP